MNYRISVSDLPAGRVQAEVMQKVSDSLSSFIGEYVVIGATARDILGLMLGAKSTRRTADLDITIAIQNWEEFDSVAQSLGDNGFRHDNYIHQRFYYGHGYSEYVLDIVPYGGISGPDAKFYWPNETDYIMSVQGFETAMKNCIEIYLEDLFSFKIPTVHSLFVLKLISWSDRKSRGVYKDAEDLDFLMRNFYLPNSTEERFIPVYEQIEVFDDLYAGAIMIAMDICQTFDTVDLIALQTIVSKELEDDSNSVLIKTCMLKHDNNFDITKTAWEYFLRTICNYLNNNEKCL